MFDASVHPTVGPERATLRGTAIHETRSLLDAELRVSYPRAVDDPFEDQQHVSGLAPDGLDADGGADLAATPAFLLGDPDGTETPSDPRPGSARSTGPRDRNVYSPPRPVVVLAADPGALPMASISPRRLLHIIAVIAVAWGVISFGRQVATASTASSHADSLRAANVAITNEVAALQRELALVQDQRYIDLQARAYRLGSRDEIAFALEGDPPALPPDAPGSAAVRLGADVVSVSPLERWIDLLFGPGG